MCSQVAGTAWGLSLSSVVALHPAIQLPSLLSIHVFHKIPKQAYGSTGMRYKQSSPPALPLLAVSLSYV